MRLTELLSTERVGIQRKTGYQGVVPWIGSGATANRDFTKPQALTALSAMLAGGYLTYFWGRIQFGSSATLADDPIVGAATRFSAHMQSVAGQLGISFVLALALLVLFALTASIVRSAQSRIRTAARRPDQAR